MLSAIERFLVHVTDIFISIAQCYLQQKTVLLPYQTSLVE